MVAEGNAVGATADPPPFWKAGPCLEDDPLAKNESCQAQVNVAVDRISTDPVSAMAALRALAEQGSVYAMLQLAAACQESAKQANHKEAEFWWRRALAAGSPHAAFYLGALYRDDGDMDRACEVWTLGRTRGCAACANFLRETEEYQRENHIMRHCSALKRGAEPIWREPLPPIKNWPNAGRGTPCCNSGEPTE